MTSTDVDKVYIERILPRLIEGTPTENIRRWSVSAHSVMEVTGPSPFGEDGNVLLWLHEKSLTKLLDMCDAVDERFSEVEQAATLDKTCKNIDQDYPSLFECSECNWECTDTYCCDSEFNYCPNCGRKVVNA